MSETTRRAVSYLRVSSAAQAETDFDQEGFSLPAQREACERRASVLGAELVEEFMDRGISATSTRRPGLQAMLARLVEGGIDYVIVHKVDRLARNRADDVAIVMAIREAGAQLVSTSENVDETPSGLLLHGIMSSIAEFYSKNLATEIIKGSTQKAKKGGTPYKAPLGYRNHREWVDGREIRTIIIDAVRGPLITRAFALYATGEFALSDLAAVLEAEGLRTNATRKLPEQRVGANRLSTILRNDYYLGIVRYGGKTYPGRHDALVDEATFERVQDVLSAQRHAGERSWKHHHYLVGSLFCAECHGRLIYSRNRGNTGAVYEYFFCVNRRDGSCGQPHHRVEAVAAAVEDYYAKIELTAATRADIRRTARQRLEMIGERSGVEVARAEQVLGSLRAQEKKLLAAHYADEISGELFSEEQHRLRRERVAAEATIARLGRDFEAAESNLDLTLNLTDDVQSTYRRGNDEQRRLFNQGIFERIEIDRERVESATLASPFAEVLMFDAEPADALAARLDPDGDAWAAWSQPDAGMALAGAPGPGNAKNPGPSFKDLGSNVQSLVPLRGFEPRFPP